MKIQKNIILWGISALFVYLIVSVMTGSLRLPGFSVYKTYPNVIGGCFNICEGEEKLIGCKGNPDDFKDSFASCTYYCIGKLSNNCK